MSKDVPLFEDLPGYVRSGLCDINFDVGVIKKALDNPEIFSDPDFAIRERLDAILETLGKLLI